MNNYEFPRRDAMYAHAVERDQAEIVRILTALKKELEKSYAGDGVTITVNQNVKKTVIEEVIRVAQGQGWTVKYSPGGYDQRDTWDGSLTIS